MELSNYSNSMGGFLIKSVKKLALRKSMNSENKKEIDSSQGCGI